MNAPENNSRYSPSDDAATGNAGIQCIYATRKYISLVQLVWQCFPKSASRISSVPRGSVDIFQ